MHISSSFLIDSKPTLAPKMFDGSFVITRGNARNFDPHLLEGLVKFKCEFCDYSHELLAVIRFHSRESHAKPSTGPFTRKRSRICEAEGKSAKKQRYQDPQEVSVKENTGPEESTELDDGQLAAALHPLQL